MDIIEAFKQGLGLDGGPGVSSTPTATMGHGPGGLMSSPGLGGGQRQLRRRKRNCSRLGQIALKRAV